MCKLLLFFLVALDEGFFDLGWLWVNSRTIKFKLGYSLFLGRLWVSDLGRILDSARYNFLVFVGVAHHEEFEKSPPGLSVFLFFPGFALIAQVISRV